jgi:lysophospholipase L1-like esterase
MVFGGLLVGIVSSELLLRALGPAPIVESEWMLDSPTIVFDPDVIVVPRRILTLGREVENKPHPIILAIGDSFTAGHPVGQAHSYPTILQETLRGEGIRATVLNAGLGDSGPDQHLRLFQAYVLPYFTPTVVIWSLYMNDFRDNVSKAAYTLDEGELTPLSGRWNWIYLRQMIYDRLPLPARMKRHSRIVRLCLKAMEELHRIRIPSAYRDNPTEWGVEKLRREIAAMNTLAAARGFTAYYLLIAPQSVYLAAREPQRWRDNPGLVAHRRLSALLRDQPTLVDTETEAGLDTEAFVDSTRDPVELGGRHYNGRGYALVAKAVASRLRRDAAAWNQEGSRR